ncbi:hypothetical protein MRB53_019327 [Persea americana]|uniref:Uncharacterized protein n=1 Tax=Persea americana TaxID=3435 RepID=A0ACC2KY70_PERAE|nr:hypothetical protein MRB53_019327 [Persea americana]
MEFHQNKEEENWKCRKHPSQPHNGVCPTCLRNRLVLLCPDCANASPCACSSSPRLSSDTGAFHRSRSAAFQFLRRSSGDIRPPPPPPENERKSSFWSLFRSEKKASDLPRSTSVGFSCYKEAAGDVGMKSRRWYFPSSIMGFRRPKAVSQQSQSCRR